jgi:hypothetical protein
MTVLTVVFVGALVLAGIWGAVSQFNPLVGQGGESTPAATPRE